MRMATISVTYRVYSVRPRKGPVPEKGPSLLDAASFNLAELTVL
jgi:hypothetical protein